MLKRNSLKILGCLLLLVVFLIATTKPLEAKSANREYTIKASLIINFLDFIKWPNGTLKRGKSPKYKLCVLGENRFGNIFRHEINEGLFEYEIISRNNVKNREIISCNILFLTGENLPQLKNVIQEFHNKPTLIISESEGYGNLGADINLIKEKNKIKFEINRVGLEKKGFKLSSYLLNLAIIIDKDKK